MKFLFEKEKNNFLAGILRSIVTTEKIIENNEEIINKINILIDQNNLYLADNQLNIKENNKSGPHYNPNNKTVNIPVKYKEKTNVDVNFKEIEVHLKDNTFQFLICHEIGHAVQHSSIGNQYIKFQAVNFDKGSQLNYLFNGSSIPSSFNVFLAKNYQEIYADCYAGYCLFRLTNNTNIFDEIQNFRTKQKNKYKLVNPNIYHEYYETSGINFFKQEILNNTKINDYKDIQDLIHKSILKGITKTLVEELETNDSLLKSFNDFSYDLDKKTHWKAFLIDFMKVVKNIM